MPQCRSNLKSLLAALILIRQLKNLGHTGHSLHLRCIRLRIPLPGKGAYQNFLWKFSHRACLPSRLRPILGSLLKEASRSKKQNRHVAASTSGVPPLIQIGSTWRVYILLCTKSWIFWCTQLAYLKLVSRDKNIFAKRRTLGSRLIAYLPMTASCK